MNTSIFEQLDTLLMVSTEMIPDNGEDCFCASAKQDSVMMGVFDGCGGMGSRKYSGFQQKTGAYMASRLAAGAVYDWYRTTDYHEDITKRQLVPKVLDCIIQSLKIGDQKAGEALKLRGSMVRDFPSTATIIIADADEYEKHFQVLWAGDSRAYMMDDSGLFQITKDDTGCDDAMDSLRNDPPMTNILSSDGNSTLNCRRITWKKPVMIIAATDGYHSYWKTPMDFEYFLLSTLEKAKSPKEWKKFIKDDIYGVTGDDATIGIMCFGYGTFSALQSHFAERKRIMEEMYINPLRRDYSEELGRTLWDDYKKGYNRYLFS